MVFLTPPSGNWPELSDAEFQAMRETVARALEVTAEISGREQQDPQGLIRRGRFTRDGMNVATELMGIQPVSDEEWDDIRDPLD